MSAFALSSFCTQGHLKFAFLSFRKQSNIKSLLGLLLNMVKSCKKFSYTPQQQVQHHAMHGWLSEISIKGVDGQETWLVRSSLRLRRITVPSASSSDWHLGLTTPHLIQRRTFQSTRSTSTTTVDMWMRPTVTSQYRILSNRINKTIGCLEPTFHEPTPLQI